MLTATMECDSVNNEFEFQKTHHYDRQIGVPACVYEQISPPSGYQKALF